MEATAGAAAAAAVTAATVSWLSNIFCRGLRKRLEAVEKQQKEIMATQAETIAQLNQLRDDLAASAAKVTKIGTETDALLARVKALEEAAAAGDVSPAIADAIAAVRAQADAVATAAQADDEKVPDAPPNP